MPGSPDVWNSVTFAARLTAPLTALRRRTGGTGPAAALPDDASAPDERAASPAPRRRRTAGIAAGVAVAVLAGGSVAVGAAHKTVTLDVDGEISEISTFAGSVDGVLTDEGVDLGQRDTVAPAGTAALTDGAEIVVRHARQVTVTVDGAEADVWTTALSADEALGALSTRGGDVRLVASRSAAGRAEIDLDLDGPVEVAVDGDVHAVTDTSGGVAAVLEGLGITLGELDTVSVRHSETGAVTVVVTRVLVQEVPEVQPIPFESVQQDDAERFVGTTAVVTEGAEGQRTLVHRVTTVDGVETARELVSDTVTAEPVTRVVAVGTKARPVAPKPAPKPAAKRSGGSAPAATSASAGGLNWAALAACESGGRVDAVSSTGKYHGLYQFSVATWNAVGGSGLPSQASAAEQTQRAQMLFDRAGAGQWPHCGPRLFR